MDDPLPPLLFPAATSTERRWLAGLKADGRIRLVGPRLYTSVPEPDVPRAIHANWTQVVSRLFPSALLGHRSALEFKPSPERELFLTANTNRSVAYPGLTLRFVRGPGPLPDDPSFAGVRCSSQARAFLENLGRPTPAYSARVLSRDDLELRLEGILRANGEPALNALRDRARVIAAELGWQAPLARLEGLIGGLLGTRSGQVNTARGLARFAGTPFDPACVERLQLLAAELRARPLPELPEDRDAPEHFTNKAFFESYFSNFIEGTTFEIEEAEAIVFEGKVLPARPKDAHDILGTFAVASDPNEMRRTPHDLAAFQQLLRQRHLAILHERPEVLPGQFKTRSNRAGDTHFVAPELVIGTLGGGLHLYESLPPGLARAIFMMFLVADVHPFEDGNGRIARLMMNAELVTARRTTIIIPTVFREDYVNALRALTRRHRPAPIVDALIKAQQFSNLAFSRYPVVLDELRKRNWFRDPGSARIIVEQP